MTCLGRIGSTLFSPHNDFIAKKWAKHKLQLNRANLCFKFSEKRRKCFQIYLLLKDLKKLPSILQIPCYSCTCTYNLHAISFKTLERQSVRWGHKSKTYASLFICRILEFKRASMNHVFFWLCKLFKLHIWTKTKM